MFIAPTVIETLFLDEFSENMKYFWQKSHFKAVYQSSGEGNGTPLQYSCLENPMDGGAWWATVHGVAKSQTLLSDFTYLQSLEQITIS